MPCRQVMQFAGGSMDTSVFVSKDEIRSRFSGAMSAMYQQEVPQYGALLSLVHEINASVLKHDPALRSALQQQSELTRLDVERHGAIRVGTAAELKGIAKIFAVMGMYPVAYYDLSVAGVPVHSTAFRPVDDHALQTNPFRVFTSLLRLELIEDANLRAQAAAILSQRTIFPSGLLELAEQAHMSGGLTELQVTEFVAAATAVFRWHRQATVDQDTYRKLHEAHRLVADIVCFKGPHINHLTPRTLDIDAVQEAMPQRGIPAKELIEGPPRRRHPILLRQTSFKALEEEIEFAGQARAGSHTARFGEIEQRGVALTQAGRALYDSLLAQARDAGQQAATTQTYAERLQHVFAQFPDDSDEMYERGLAFFRFEPRDPAIWQQELAAGRPWNLPDLIKRGVVALNPITYEDFLPVSAAGIFQSNLGDAEQRNYVSQAARSEFERDLGGPVLDEIELYRAAQMRSEHALQQRFLAESRS